MVILGNALFGHIETGGTGKRMAAGPSSDKSAVAVMLDFKNDTLYIEMYHDSCGGSPHDFRPEQTLQKDQ